MTDLADPLSELRIKPIAKKKAPVAVTPRPPKRNLFGINVSPTTYAECVDTCIAMAKNGERGMVDFAAVHSLITFARDPKIRHKLNAFDIVCPDGQPVRWALNWFYKAKLTDRVYGPTLTLKLCEAAAAHGVSIYLWGGTEDVLAKLQSNLLEKFPLLKIAGAESPPFRKLAPEEDVATVERINASGAGLVFLGIGCPKQELFAWDHRESIRAVQLCVGAAFDFHAGIKKQAPAWMQKRGLEWLFRLVSEPGRLWKRYLVTNSLYLWSAMKQTIFGAPKLDLRLGTGASAKERLLPLTPTLSPVTGRGRKHPGSVAESVSQTHLSFIEQIPRRAPRHSHSAIA